MALEEPGPDTKPPTFAESLLGPVIAAARRALKDEIEVARRDPSRLFLVTAGVRVSESDEGYLYHFKSDVALPIPADTPIMITLEDGESARGVLVGLQDFDVFLAAKVDLGENVPKAKVSSEPWFIWQSLENRLEEIESEPAGDLEIPLALVNLVPAQQDSDDAAAERTLTRLRRLRNTSLHPNSSQRAAMSRCAGSAVHYVWGPPGTGKTANLAQVAATLVDQGESVLVLAHANVAVDVAILRVADAFEGTEELANSRILRLGVPQLPDVRERRDITPEDALAKTQPDLVRRKEELKRRLDDITRKLRNAKDPEAQRLLGRELEEVRKELARVREEISAAVVTLVAQAKVLAATLSRFSIDDRLFQWPADAVLVDEASMAPFPAVLAAGICAHRRMVVLGDFRQLPPIVLSSKRDAREWIGRDAFEIAGIVDIVDAGGDDPRVTLLDTQYRMSSEIAAVVSDLAYGGLLKTGAAVDERNGGIVQFEPRAGHSAVFVDTSLLDPVCFREPRSGSFSRVNPVHAILSVGLAEKLLEQGCPKVAIVTPYRSQARLVSSFLHDHPLGDRLRAATVHRLQGFESEAVIVDLVDAPEMRGASRLTGKDRDTARRLLNVALSRAKGKLLVLIPETFLRRTQRPTGIVPTAVARLRARGGEWHPVPSDVAAMLQSDAVEWADGWASCEGLVRGILSRTADRLFVNIPGALRCSEAFLSELQAAANRVEHTVVFAPSDVAEALENTRADLRLMNQPGGFFVLADGVVAVLGGTAGVGLFARVDRKKVVDSLEELFLGDSLRGPGPQADTEHAVDALCGRCVECGEIRRPRKADRTSWLLGCPSSGHAGEPLGFNELRNIVGILQIRCGECDGDAVLRDGRRGPFLGCVNFAAGCPGDLPRLETVFAES